MRHTFATLAFALLAASGARAQAPDVPVLRSFKLAPSADLQYAIQARQKGFMLPGEALVTWRAGDGKYAVTADTRSPLLGKIVENRSQGTIDIYGLAPAEFIEKRFRKEPTTTTFRRDAKTIGFSDGNNSYPIKGGEQDRASATWQLVAVARAAPDKFVAGAEFTFFVAGPRDAEPWTFKVLKREKVQAGEGIGEVDAVHILRAPPPDQKGQVLDIWLAPGLEWYPVRLRFSDDNDFVEQRLEKITKR